MSQKKSPGHVLVISLYRHTYRCHLNSIVLSSFREWYATKIKCYSGEWSEIYNDRLITHTNALFSSSASCFTLLSKFIVEFSCTSTKHSNQTDRDNWHKTLLVLIKRREKRTANFSVNFTMVTDISEKESQKIFSTRYLSYQFLCTKL